MKVTDIKMYEARAKDAVNAYHNAVAQLPIGTEVGWMRGAHRQCGEIIRHCPMGRVRVRNFRTESEVFLEASDLLP